MAEKKQKSSSIKIMFICFFAVVYSCAKEIPVSLDHEPKPINDPIAGSTWTSISGPSMPNSQVLTMRSFNGYLYLIIHPNPVASFRYDGEQFFEVQPMPSQIYSGGGIQNLEVSNGVLYGTGNIGMGVSGVRMTNSLWDILPTTSSATNSVVDYNGKLIMAFDVAPFIRELVNGNWVPFGSELDGICNKLIVHNGELFAGGYFENNLGTGSPLNNIAKWNGSDWVSVGNVNFTGVVFDMVSYNNDLIVGGAFTIINNSGQSYSNVARWRGSTWESLGDGLTSSVRVFCLDVYDGQLFVGGEFGGGGSEVSQNIIKWTDEYGFSSLAQGVTEVVGCVSVYNGKLYVSNKFFIPGMDNVLYRLD